MPHRATITCWSDKEDIPLGYEGIGFRDDGIDSQAFAIALGDSYTWGDGVDNDETWNVVNLGVSGYGTLQRLRVLQTYGPTPQAQVGAVEFLSK